MSLIKLEDVCKFFGANDTLVKAVNHTSFVINEGEYVSIIGASGSGKSTLMNIIGCLDMPTSGKFFLDDRDVSTLSERSLAKIRSLHIGFVFQFFNLVPKMSIIRNVQLPLIYQGIARHESKERAQDALNSVGLTDKHNAYPHQLSGGQQQRAAIARALVTKPRILLADEPTGTLDTETSYEILKIFHSLIEQGTTILTITHNPEIARNAKRIITISDGSVIEDKALDEYERINLHAFPSAEADSTQEKT